MRKACFILLSLVVLMLPARAQSAMLLSNVRRIYIEKMPDNLDQYLASSISSKFTVR